MDVFGELPMRYLLLSLFFLFPSFASAQELHTFSNGELADAEKINENFEALKSEISGGGGCSAEQDGSSVVITCADGTSAVVQNTTTIVELNLTGSATSDYGRVYTDGQLLGQLMPQLSAWHKNTYVVKTPQGFLMALEIDYDAADPYDWVDDWDLLFLDADCESGPYIRVPGNLPKSPSIKGLIFHDWLYGWVYTSYDQMFRATPLSRDPYFCEGTGYINYEPMLLPVLPNSSAVTGFVPPESSDYWDFPDLEIRFD